MVELCETMKVLFLVSAFNGLTQRVWCELRRAGHDVVVHVAEQADDMREVATTERPDLILCPFLKARIPEDVWHAWPTIIIHPGPVGDQGPSSLDWAIAEAEPRWGVTALQAVEEMDAGPIWATRTFTMPDQPVRKSALYNGPVADAAMECVIEVLAKAQDPGFTPTPLIEASRPVVSARLRPSMKQTDREFSWADRTERIVRLIRAADGAPGVRTELAGLQVYAYDAHPGHPVELERHGAASPGQVLCHDSGAIHVRTGDGSVWLGHLRATPDMSTDSPIKLPVMSVLRDRLTAAGPLDCHQRPNSQISYHRDHQVGWLTFDFYNGAMSTRHCQQLAAALRRALTQDTTVLVLSGSPEVFSNGIHLNEIEAASSPPHEGWSNIKAINDLCKYIILSPMKIITALTGSSGAGGVMLALGADVVVSRAGVVLNPYYDIGLNGSELHTYTLPRRVGEHTAKRLLEQRQPVDSVDALSIGLVDDVGPRDPDDFTSWLADLARSHAAKPARIDRTNGNLPLDAIEARELAEMSRDMFDDRLGFAAARHAFVHKKPRTRELASVS